MKSEQYDNGEPQSSTRYQDYYVGLHAIMPLFLIPSIPALLHIWRLLSPLLARCVAFSAGRKRDAPAERQSY